MRKNPVTMLVLSICAVLLIAIVAIVLSEARRNATFPAASPQGVIRNYLEAISSDDKTRAYSYVASESPCTRQDLDAAFGAPIDSTIVQFAKIDGDRGQVGIRVEYAYDGIFGGRLTRDHTFALVREGGAWKITGTFWPMDKCSA